MRDRLFLIVTGAGLVSMLGMMLAPFLRDRRKIRRATRLAPRDQKYRGFLRE